MKLINLLKEIKIVNKKLFLRRHGNTNNFSVLDDSKKMIGIVTAIKDDNYIIGSINQDRVLDYLREKGIPWESMSNDNYNNVIKLKFVEIID